MRALGPALFAQLSRSGGDNAATGLAGGLHHDFPASAQCYAPELEKCCRPPLKATTNSWRVDETSVKVKKTWMDLDRAVDTFSTTLDFWLSPPRDAQAANQFFCQALTISQTTEPRVITVDKNAASPKAFSSLKAEGALPEDCERRQVNYLHTIVEHDHRLSNRRVKPGLGFFSPERAWNIFQGEEVMHMLGKGQMRGVAKGGSLGQGAFISSLFGVAA